MSDVPERLVQMASDALMARAQDGWWSDDPHDLDLEEMARVALTPVLTDLRERVQAMRNRVVVVPGIQRPSASEGAAAALDGVLELLGPSDG